ncbi:MAG TPA: sialidase family protein [Pseudomonadales bacterium]|nr:sialidase family protein [Pseudomonadales bacterium]
MDIFDSTTAPTPSCHASTIAECDGKLVAAWFGGEHERHPQVTIWFAERDGEAWSKPRQIAEGGEPDNPVACWNPVLYKVDAGPLILFYKVGLKMAVWRTFMKTSEDSGNSWSPPRALGGDIEGPVKNKPVMVNGTLVCPSSTEPSWRQWLTYMSLTSDLGNTWERIGPLNDPQEFQAIQPTLLTHRDVRLQALCRTRSGVIAETWSEDGGRSWSAMAATSLPNPNSGIDAVTLADGRHLLVYNHTKEGRSPLNVAISEDGINWSMIRTLESDEGEYSYPAVIQASDGTVHITYTKNRRTIGHVEHVVSTGAP